MDTTTAHISFNSDGLCNYCTKFYHRPQTFRSILPNSDLLNLVKRPSSSSNYDCVVGLSGGIDSSWVLVSAVKLGLRPLAVHMDNGWNSTLAQRNIANLIDKLGVDLYTHVIDWDEYRSLLLSFIDSDVIDLELLYDNAMFGTLYHTAHKFGLKTILGGMNLSTEGVEMPYDWNWFKFDLTNIKAINRRFGNTRLKTFPGISFPSYLTSKYFHRISWVNILDHIDYRKSHALHTLVSDYNYTPYPYKHYESIFTRFYQGYILPKKFNVDKRKVHHSSLIVTGQMTRDEALADLQRSPYPNSKDMSNDLQYVLKKLDYSIDQFEQYLQRPAKPHDTYPSERRTWTYISSQALKLRSKYS
jgi:N-acetyl sugar amidotransferase